MATINMVTGDEQAAPTLEESAAQLESATQTNESVESAQNAEGGDQDRPEWLPEKFKSPEDLAKSYAELEAKLSQPEGSQTQEAQEVVESAGLNYDSYAEELSTNGSLSDNSYQELQNAGIPKDMVDAYIAGQTALANQQLSEVKNTVGGDQAYNDLTQWAVNNLTQQEITAFNNTVENADIETAKFAVQGLYSRFQQAQGSEPRYVSGTTQDVQGDVYQSWAQITQDMTKPEYRNDPAFRKSVEAKIARSRI